MLGSGGVHLYSYHLGGRSRQISVCLRPAGLQPGLPGQPGLHKETLFKKTKIGQNKTKKGPLTLKQQELGKKKDIPEQAGGVPGAG